ncbi:hypothetical protein [Sphingomonas japonica]|uniref:Uncharacterized protein n=1 Tax=Sphingomonas japonica TaxID=511662 RepID=A0ABX0TX66_9SPHN|nr:hypothetical protein [Sphingomonas japonica]NIJ22890.1 hypothetical protein [Sphingomonas japonica]
MRLVHDNGRQAPDPAIVAAAATARYRVQAHFMALHALEPGDAIEYAPPGKLERKQFDKLLERGIVRAAAPGHYWIDLSRLDAHEEAVRKRNWPLAFGATLLFVLALLLVVWGL